MSTVKQKYLKDENGSKISPITSGDSVFDKTNNPITEWTSNNGYVGSLAGWYKFPNGKLIIQWGQQSLTPDNNWIQEGNDYYKDVPLYKEILGGQPFANFFYVAGVDHVGASLTQNPSTQKFNSIRLRTKVNPSTNSLIKINWFVIGVLS